MERVDLLSIQRHRSTLPCRFTALCTFTAVVSAPRVSICQCAGSRRDVYFLYLLNSSTYIDETKFDLHFVSWEKTSPLAYLLPTSNNGKCQSPNLKKKKKQTFAEYFDYSKKLHLVICCLLLFYTFMVIFVLFMTKRDRISQFSLRILL